MAAQVDINNTAAATTYAMPRELWRHPDPKSTNMDVFRKRTNARYGLNLQVRCCASGTQPAWIGWDADLGPVKQTSADLHKWSVDNLSAFWGDIWDTVGIIHEGTRTTVRSVRRSRACCVNADVPALSRSSMKPPGWTAYPTGSPGSNLISQSWCVPSRPGDRSRVADLRQVLFTKGPKGPLDITTVGKEDNKVALTSAREGGTDIYQVTWGQLRQQIGHISQALRAHGVKKGDRVAGVVSNSVEALAVFLATVAIGAIFSSSSTDMGTKGVLDRVLQIEPVYIFMDDAAVYNRKKTDLRPKMSEIVEGMRSVKEFKGMVALPRFTEPVDISAVPRW